MSIEIHVVHDGRGRKRFIDLPHDLYRDDPCYVPQLFLEQKDLLGPENPFRAHADMELFLAWREGCVVGRVAAIHNRLYDEHHETPRGFFGFFDCEENAEVASALMTACRSWLVKRGLEDMWGPVNPDLNHGCGVLTEGFAHRPAIFMPYNASYYGPLLETAGLSVIKRLNAWEIASSRVPEETLRYATRTRERLERQGYVLRAIDMRDFAGEMSRLRAVYNDALAGSWGHTPLTEAEFSEQARWLKRICRPEYIQIAEHRKEIVGFIGAVPDFNEALRHVHRGRLLPAGWLKLLRARRKIEWGRIVMYGVHRDHRGVGLANWLYVAIIEALRARGYVGAEASYVLEDNRPVNDLSERIGGIRHKRYAIYGFSNGGG